MRAEWLRVCYHGRPTVRLAISNHVCPSNKPGRSTAYTINPTHGNIAVVDQQYQINLHAYHLVKNMNSAQKKIIVAAIDNQWIKGENYMVMGHAKKSFIGFMDWIYVRYDQITPKDLMKN